MPVIVAWKDRTVTPTGGISWRVRLPRADPCGIGRGGFVGFVIEEPPPHAVIIATRINSITAPFAFMKSLRFQI
jgi:hypothetical protein